MFVGKIIRMMTRDRRCDEIHTKRNEKKEEDDSKWAIEWLGAWA